MFKYGGEIRRRYWCGNMEESVRLEDIEVDVRIESECILNWIVGRGMDSSGSRQRLSEGCYEHADELTDTMT